LYRLRFILAAQQDFVYDQREAWMNAVLTADWTVPDPGAASPPGSERPLCSGYLLRRVAPVHGRKSVLLWRWDEAGEDRDQAVDMLKRGLFHLRMEIEPLSAERSLVTVEGRSDRALRPMVALLKEIAQRYPEAAEPIAAWAASSLSEDLAAHLKRQPPASQPVPAPAPATATAMGTGTGTAMAMAMAMGTGTPNRPTPDERRQVLRRLQRAYLALCRAYANGTIDTDRPERRPTLREFAEQQRIAPATLRRRLKRLGASWRNDFARLPIPPEDTEAAEGEDAMDIDEPDGSPIAP
jgi:hypothetical protein